MGIFWLNAAEGGISDSIRRMIASLSGILATKLELLGVELQEEKHRIIELLILASATLLFDALSLTIITFGIVVLLLEKMEVNQSSMIIVFFAVGALYAVLAFLLYRGLRYKLHETTLVFEATTEELKKDAQWIKGKMPHE
jgi:uncharacterized membrane protein YqjE